MACLFGATFQLGGGGLPSISLAINWLRRSPAALDITYLPQMDSHCAPRVAGGRSVPGPLAEALGKDRGNPGNLVLMARALPLASVDLG